jgi:AcrR family transcriptional regulator
MRTLVKDKKLVDKRRQQIADGAIRVFVKIGFDKATMRQLAKAAKLSIGNIYNYVKSKEDVLFLSMELGAQAASDLASREINTDSNDPVKDLRESIIQLFKTVDTMEEYVLFVYQDLRQLPAKQRQHILGADQEVVGWIQKLLSDGIKRGMFKVDIDTRLVSENIVMAAHMWSLRRWSLTKNYTLDKYIKLQLCLLAESICTDGYEKTLASYQK